MACFTAPLAGAAVAAVVQKAAGGKSRNPFLRKLHWLVKMALGGSFLLAIEHIYHGEITTFPPFLRLWRRRIRRRMRRGGRGV